MSQVTPMQWRRLSQSKTIGWLKAQISGFRTFARSYNKPSCVILKRLQSSYTRLILVCIWWYMYQKLDRPRGKSVWPSRTHDDVIKRKHFPRNWPFVRGIHRSPTLSFDVFFDLRLNKRLSKQSWGWWFKTLSRPLWRHCNGHCR